MQKWEYKLVPSERDVEALLNQLGAEGWELIAINIGHSPGSRAMYYLKRPKQET